MSFVPTETEPYSGHSFIKVLGSGNFGVTKLYKDDTTGELVAVKFLKRGRQIADTVAYVEREILNHMQLSGHPNIVRFKEVFLTPQHLAIAMEFAAGGELFERIAAAGRFSEDVARYFFQQLISGVAWCHHNSVCHRDLKLENSLLDKPIPASALFSLPTLLACRPRLKICDFGYSKSGEFDSRPKSTVGTPAYIAPEVLGRREYDGEIADVWSCGVTLYVMLVGAYPFEDPADPRNFRETIERIVMVQYSFPREVPVSPVCRDLLSRIFVSDPSRRLTLDQIQQHPWFLKNLPEELQGLGVRAAPHHIDQTEDEVRQHIIGACTLDQHIADAAQQGAALAEYADQVPRAADSMGSRYVDAYMDTAGMDEEMLYTRSTPPGQAAPTPPLPALTDQQAAHPAGPQAPAHGPDTRQGAGALPAADMAVDPDLAYELGDDF